LFPAVRSSSATAQSNHRTTGVKALEHAGR